MQQNPGFYISILWLSIYTPVFTVSGGVRHSLTGFKLRSHAQEIHMKMKHEIRSSADGRISQVSSDFQVIPKLNLWKLL